MPTSKQPEPSNHELTGLLEHYQNRRYVDAEKLALILTKKFETHPFGWKVLGAIFNQTGRLSEGLIACQKSVLLEPKNPEAHNNLGNTLQKLEKLEEAEESYRKAISLKQNYPEAHNNLGNTLKEFGRLEDALASYKKAIEFKPNYAEAHYNKANAYQEMGRTEEAENYYRKAIELKSNYAEAYNNLGITLKELGRLEESEESYIKAIELKPEFSSALLNRGQLCVERGEFESSLKYFDQCNTKNSRARALSSLYALGKTEDIYKRIEILPEEDEENIKIAAFCAFLEEREKKDTSHNFCKNPLEFIHFSNISSHLENSNLFIVELIEELKNVKTNWEPYNKATQRGFQSKINIFKNPLKKISYLESLIKDELEIYFSKFENESCAYIQKWPLKKNLVGWHVILKQQGNQKVHIHPSGWLSGVIYLKVVPTLGNDEGAIEFGLNGKRYSHPNSPKLIHQPRLGDIVLFPSSLHHRTIPFSTDTDRIIVSFDLMPNRQ